MRTHGLARVTTQYHVHNLARGETGVRKVAPDDGHADDERHGVDSGVDECLILGGVGRRTQHPSPTTERDMTSNDVQITDQDIRDKLTGVLGFTSIDLATSKDGVNWCSNAFFAELDADPFRLTLVLESGGRTLDSLRANPSIGVKVVPDGFLNPFAQGLGTAVVRTETNEREETFRSLLRKEPRIEPFLSTPIEAVEVRIDWWRVTHVQGGWLPGRVLHRPGAS
ncbi:hypothetical protein [Nocardia gipuzkoensis]